MRNDGPNILYLLIKSTIPDTSIGVSNLKYYIKKSTLANVGNNVKDLIYDRSLSYSVLIDKEELHKDYVCHIFRDLLSGLSSTFNNFIERTKSDWGKGT